MGWRVAFLSGWVPLLSDDMQLAESLTHEATIVEEMAHIGVYGKVTASGSYAGYLE
jgi:hypothetical protein